MVVGGWQWLGVGGGGWGLGKGGWLVFEGWRGGGGEIGEKWVLCGGWRIKNVINECFVIVLKK